MKADWQAFEAGLMGPQERAGAEQALKRDPQARRELDGLKLFRRAVRSAAQRETVPTLALEASLARVVGRVPLPAWRVRLTAALAVVCALALAGIAYKNWPPASVATAQAQTKGFTQFEDSRKWAQSVSGLAIPNVGLDSQGSMMSAHAAEGWACFDYNVDSQYVHVRVSSVGHEDASCGVQDHQLDGFNVGDRSPNVSFMYSGLTVLVKSPNREFSLKIAKGLSQHLPVSAHAGTAAVAR